MTQKQMIRARWRPNLGPPWPFSGCRYPEAWETWGMEGERCVAFQTQLDVRFWLWCHLLIESIHFNDTARLWQPWGAVVADKVMGEALWQRHSKHEDMRGGACQRCEGASSA